MKKSVKTCSDCIDILCEKFRKRGITQKAENDAEQSRKKTQNVQKRLLQDGISQPDAEKYKTGNYNGVMYMTSADFSKYYEDTRKGDLPSGTPSNAEEYEKAASNNAAKPTLQTKKELRLAVMKHLGKKAKRWGMFPPNPKRFIEETNEGFDEDKPEDRGYSKGKKLPYRVLPVISVIFVSLLLVVASSVMVSRSESDVARLERRLDELEGLERKLNGELEKKNNMITIKEKAESEYGMVGAEYVLSKYIYIERNDKIEMGNDMQSKSGLARMLSALGFID